MDKGKYTEGELTKILTARYIAQYPYVLTNADVVVKDNIIQSYNNGNTLSAYIVIPDTLDGQAVKGIKENYLFGPFSQHSILGIELPNTLEYIPAYAFYGTDLIEIELPQHVSYVGANAFIASSISELTLPDCSTNGFVGWLKSTGDFVSSTDTGYVVTNLGISYTAAYKVLFKDFDGTLLKTDTVKHYVSALPPSDPTRAGYTFFGWDIDYSNITKGITVTAQYTQNGVNNYTVTFKDWDGTIINTQFVAENNAAIAPSEPTRTGYTFTGWDKDFSKITSDVTVIAQYSINSYTVTFTDYDGTVLKSESVEYEKAATAPSEPSRTGYTFTAWDKDFSKITSNLTVTAQYSLSTSMEAIKENEDIIVYPIPAKNSLMIEIKKPYEITDFDRNISILDSNGKLVYHSTNLSAKHSIDVSNLQNGVYFVRIGNVIKKIIKE